MRIGIVVDVIVTSRRYIFYPFFPFETGIFFIIWKVVFAKHFCVQRNCVGWKQVINHVLAMTFSFQKHSNGNSQFLLEVLFNLFSKGVITAMIK